MKPKPSTPSFTAIQWEMDSSGNMILSWCGHKHNRRDKAERCRLAMYANGPSYLHEKNNIVAESWWGKNMSVKKLLEDDEIEDEDLYDND